ncbi:cell envelope integrity TolA C-terminal domain-containing protein, partial [Enterobacter hormaechei]
SSLPGGNEEQKKFSAAMGSLLYYAMLNGFSGFDYPRPPEQKEKPVSSFNPNEICDDISSKAAKYSTSNLPPQVQISLAEWNQIKGEFQMVCFAGIMAGNNRQSVDSKILAGMNDIGKEVYLSAYRSGSEYPKPRSKNNTEKSDATARGKAAAKEKADAAGKQSATNKTKQADDYKSKSARLDSPDFQRFQSSLRNEFMRRIGDATRFSGKECSINVWMSQKGEVLSARKKSGDEELCSVVLQASKGMRLSPMSNEVYGVFRNPSLNFKF